MSLDYEAEASLGRMMFGHAQLNDKRRTDRLVKSFDRFRMHPGGTLPDKLSSPADLKAFYRLCDCPAVTHATLIESLRAYTLARIEAHPGPVLLVHDATELDYTTLTKLAAELGQIGTGTRRGYICQNVLAIDATTGAVLGLVEQILHCRDQVPAGESLAEHRDRETRESLLWIKGTAHLPSNLQLIDVADQGASTFEFLEHEAKSGRRFVIRDGKDRRASAGHEAVGHAQPLKELARSLPELGRFTMDVQPQKGRKERQGAEFTLRGGPVLVRPPHAHCGHHGRDPLPLYVAHVIELSPPPPGEKPIEWRLLTNEPVQTLEDTWRVVGWYERRWIVEEYHKGLKTGCRIEDLQFTAVVRLQPAIALLSAVALTLLNLRDVSRRPDAQTRRATTVVATEYVEVLSNWRFKKPRRDLTVHEFFLALARLGGHQNRRHDHRPGWLVLWRGWMKLQLLLDGYLAAQHQRSG